MPWPAINRDKYDAFYKEGLRLAADKEDTRRLVKRLLGDDDMLPIFTQVPGERGDMQPVRTPTALCAAWVERVDMQPVCTPKRRLVRPG